MRSSFLLACLALVPITTTAQNWMVGVPVNMYLTTITHYGGCAPDVDATWTMQPSLVTGVARCAVLIDVQPPGETVTISPGLTNALEGDTLWITSGAMRSVFMNWGGGSVQLIFFDIGTPTVVGESYQCDYNNDAWMSNFGICPEGLLYMQPPMCTVQVGGTAIGEGASSLHRLLRPSAANGQRLVIVGTIGGTYRLIDAMGRSLASGSTSELVSGLDLSGWGRGQYVLEVIGASGTRWTERFMLQP